VDVHAFQNKDPMVMFDGWRFPDYLSLKTTNAFEPRKINVLQITYVNNDANRQAFSYTSTSPTSVVSLRLASFTKLKFEFRNLMISRPLAESLSSKERKSLLLYASALFFRFCCSSDTHALHPSAC